NISFVRDLLEDHHKILPDVKFWTGGPEVSFDAEAFLRRTPQVTGVMVGEGEKTFLELVRYYVDGVGSLSEISGIAYRDGEEIHHNGWRELTDLSEIPFVYEHLEDFENKIIYYESSRGCPFSCSYCLSSIDKKLRFRDFELVKKELQFFLDHRVPQVKFVDRTFNCKHEHAMTIWKYILEHDNGITNFHFEVSADLLREGEAERIKRQVDLAALLGVPRMRHDAAWAAPQGKGFEETLSVLAQRCAEIAAYAQTKGIKTMVENHGFFMQDSSRMVALVQAAAHPNFGLLCDMGNFMCVDEQSIEAVGTVAPYAVYVHAKDFLFQAAGNAGEPQGWLKTRGGNFLQGTVIGSGAVQVKRCLEILKQHGYDGFVSLEFEGPEEPTEAIRTGLERLKSYF
ncbi:MAG: TIM barrel protein, partial [Clostridiales bacterium]|nr:TIM barrel protein [Clostridiales bacterium]